MTTDDINTLVHEYTLAHGAWPSPLNYHGFPKSVCTSVNEVVCHGIPGKRVLHDGDIVNVDVTTYLPAKDGFHGDTTATFYVGTPSAEAKHVTEVARRCLELGIAEVRDGARLGDIGAAIQEYAEAQGCSVVRDYVGHGIGREFHMAPQVPHYGKRGSGQAPQGRHGLHHRADDQPRRLRVRGPRRTTGRWSPPTARCPRSSSTPCRHQDRLRGAHRTRKLLRNSEDLRGRSSDRSRVLFH